MFKTLTGQLRVSGFVEGISYLLLLGLAMPMKYYFGDFTIDEAGKKHYEYGIFVTVLGMTHGVLFIFYCALLAVAMRKYSWSLGFGAYLFIATLIPFGTFFSDRRLRDLETNPAG